MELLHKDDIEILDIIIKTCLEKHKITLDALVLPKIVKTKPEHYPNNKWEHNQKKEYYSRYIEILKNYSSIVEVTKIAEGYFLEPINPNTERFIEKGGFLQLYEEQQREEDFNKKINKGKIASARNSIWTNYTFWIMLFIAGYYFNYNLYRNKKTLIVLIYHTIHLFKQLA